MTAFLTLDLKTWIDTKCLRDRLAPVEGSIKEIYVIIARVLVGKHSKVGEPRLNNDEPFFINDQRFG